MNRKYVDADSLTNTKRLTNDFVILFLFNIDFNKVGGCPDNWEELEITQDSGEVFNFFTSLVPKNCIIQSV